MLLNLGLIKHFHVTLYFTGSDIIKRTPMIYNIELC